MLDYMDLLRKYIRHITEQEGIAFLRDYNDRNESNPRLTEDVWTVFTDEEWAELQRLEAS